MPGLSDLVAARLAQESARLRGQFAERGPCGTRHCTLDALLPDDLARQVADAFPPSDTMRLMRSFREVSNTTKSFAHAGPLVQEALFAFQAPAVVRLVESITGLRDQHPDPQLYAGGLSVMEKGHFLHPHIDNSHDAGRRHRTLNLLYYVTPGWRVEDGGHLQLWDARVRVPVTVPSLFNRLVIMETHRHSWHGVNAVRAGGGRKCVSNYYFSEHSPDGSPYFHVTSFSAPPDRPLLRMLAAADTAVRSALRTFVPTGVGRTDVHRAGP
ncbi:MAG: 2OG-Fe(II) oxygenase [Vicinamibacterales bacterium]